MVVTLDVGNTNIEFGIFEKENLAYQFRLGTNYNATADEIGLFIVQFFSHNGLKLDKIEAVVISSVVPQVNFSLKTACEKYLGKVSLFIGKELPVPMKVHGSNPSEVGADRLVDTFGAYCKYGGNLLVIDFGTATTFDIVDEVGEFHGGPTCPGINTSMEALYQNAALLPRIELKAPDSILAKDTVTSMQAGAVFGFVGAAEYIIERMKDEFGVNLKVIATGGLAPVIKSQTNKIDTLDCTLTLDGIYKAYRNSQ